MDHSRRKFIGAVSTAPLVMGATDKSGTKAPVVGEGEHTYEAIHDWGELPANIKYGNTHGVCEDSQGHIYIHHTVGAGSENTDTMVVFDAKGKFVRSWGRQWKGGAHGLFIHKEGKEEFLYLCDCEHSVVTKRTLKGEEVFTLGYPVESPAYKPGPGGERKNYRPTNIAIAPNGDIYVGDGYGSSYINQYSSKGDFIRTFGGAGTEAGQLRCPHGLIVDTRGATPTVLVADRTNKRMQRFTLDGKHMEFLEGTTSPCNFDFYKDDVLVPELQGKVTLLDRNSKVVARLGDSGKEMTELSAIRKLTRDKFTPGQFVCPHGAIFDHAGNIFVVEWVEVGRVTKLRKV